MIWQEGLKGQLNSKCSVGSLTAKKGLLHRLGQRSLTFLVFETHSIQKTFLHGPRQRTSSVLRSKQMPHSRS